MSDCANVEMRELLPELAGGALDAPTRNRVEAHVANCSECAAELETLRLVRAAFETAPAIDARRIVAALPRPVVARTRGPARVSASRWIDWRIAAALTMVTVGGLSVVVTQRMRPGIEAETSAAAPIESTVVATPMPVPTESVGRAAPRTAPLPSDTRGRATKAQLSFGGGVDDLDQAAIEALIGALDEIDRAPVVPLLEPDRVTVLPIISNDSR